MDDVSRSTATGAGERDRLREHSAALGTVRSFQRLFFTLLVLSLLIHGGAYSVEKWGKGVQSGVAAPEVEGAAGAPATDGSEDATGESAIAPDDVEEMPESVGAWSESATYVELRRYVLPLSEFVGQLSCGGLVVCGLLATHVCLSAGVGGGAATLAGFFWMLIVWALLFPWGRWLGAVQVPGVYVSVAELQSLPAAFDGAPAEALRYVRFLGYPVLVLLLALIAEWRFTAGCRRAMRTLTASRSQPAPAR